MPEAQEDVNLALTGHFFLLAFGHDDIHVPSLISTEAYLIILSTQVADLDGSYC